MRSSTYFGAAGVRPVVDPSPPSRLRDPASSGFLGSILAQIRDVVDVRLASFIASIDSHQVAYLVANGKYWQGILTPPVVPRDGGELTTDLSVHPTDQLDDWTAADLSIPANLPMSVEVFTHDGPLGKGYTTILTVTVMGNSWKRAVGFGPESFTFDWTQATKP